MTLKWSCLGIVSGLLAPEEREAVLGDFAEAGENDWRAALGVLGLVARRQTQEWQSWRPWVAAFGVAMPCSFLLMGFSLAVSTAFQSLLAPDALASNSPVLGQALAHFCLRALLLAAWSWTAAFVAGALARRTFWASAASCFLPCLFCLARFRILTLSPVCLLLFLLPAIWGAWRGLRKHRLGAGVAAVLAFGVSVLALPVLGEARPQWWSPSQLVLTLVLTWPVWYLAIAARRSNSSKHEPLANPSEWGYPR